jgi:DNA recombination protein RmuC
MNNDEGRRYRPDVVVALPENKHIVIDSKMSLTAYSRYFSSDDKAQRDAALKEHVASIRRHLDSLSLKAYQTLYQLQSLDFVFLFMPIEPALFLAVQSDRSLLDDAYAKNVILVSPSTLLANLRIVSNLWRQDGQNRNAAEIARQAGLLYDKFSGMLEDLDKVGKAMDQAQRSHQEAIGKIATGKGNLIGRVEKLRKLGAKASKELPAGLLQGLPLELDLDDEEPLLRLESHPG